MDEADYNDPRYAVRFCLVQKTSNHKSKSDAVLSTVILGSEEEDTADRVLLKEAEKQKWKPK